MVMAAMLDHDGCGNDGSNGPALLPSLGVSPSRTQFAPVGGGWVSEWVGRSVDVWLPSAVARIKPLFKYS